MLTRCDPNSLTFMNSCGKQFADEGLFCVKDQEVLNNTTFFDVYWTLDNLRPNEYSRNGAKQGQQLLQIFPSIWYLPYECPRHNQYSHWHIFR